jgi:hypothetical protein
MDEDKHMTTRTAARAASRFGQAALLADLLFIFSKAT